MKFTGEVTRNWWEPLVWSVADGHRAEVPLSLVLSPLPCIDRVRALAALDRAKRSWLISYTSPSLAGTIAAVKAGPCVTVLPANMIPAGVHPAREVLKQPKLADAEVTLIRRDELSNAAQVFADHVVH